MGEQQKVQVAGILAHIFRHIEIEPSATWCHASPAPFPAVQFWTAEHVGNAKAETLASGNFAAFCQLVDFIQHTLRLGVGHSSSPADVALCEIFAPFLN